MISNLTEQEVKELLDSIKYVLTKEHGKVHVSINDGRVTLITEETHKKLKR